MGSTKIEWATHVWNPVTGCTRVDRGCAHCYAARMASRLAGRFGYPEDHPFRVTLHPDRLEEPARWRRRRVVFVDSMGDLLHHDVPDEYIGVVFGVMQAYSDHVFIVLTKRPERAQEWFRQWGPTSCTVALAHHRGISYAGLPGGTWPLRNVILGASAHDGASFNRRAAALRAVPAACRAMSLEPLVGPVGHLDLDGIGWVIVGGESGNDGAPMHPRWAQDVRDQCVAAGVPFLFKQWGEWGPRGPRPDHPPIDTAPRVRLTIDGHNSSSDLPAYVVPGATSRTDCSDDVWMQRVGKHRAGRRLDGATHDGYPQVILDLHARTLA